MITVSAPGKIFLLGEHVVVYGKPALLAAIDKRLYVRIQNYKEVIVKTTEKDALLVRHAVEVFKKAFSIKKLPPIKITIKSQIPTGCGLGSSAAVAASTIGALAKFTKNIWDLAQINELTFEVEKKAHGNPSGADNTAIVSGGLLWYRREFDFLKSIWSFPISNYKIPHFLLLDTGRPKETTKEMVESVARVYNKRKRLVETILNDQEIQTKKLLLALRNGDRKELVQAIKDGEHNLEKIDVVGSFAKKIIRGIEGIGGAAKICGAGGKKKGSGIILCFHEDLSKIKNVAKRYSLPVFPVKLGEEGIRVEKNHLLVSDNLMTT